ncbi:MAG: Peptidase family [Planctomycetota bacterium]|nr:Peptidase family [Planctomycetota bacterium]
MSYGEADRPGISINPRLIIAAVIALFGIVTYFARTQVNPVTGEKQHIAMSVDQEKALGLEAAPKMAAEMGGDITPGRDPRAALVQEVGRRLVENTEAGKSPYADNFHFHLLNDPNTINAFALPGGQIFITKALFDKLDDEAELAGVLGHEIGHVIHRHSAQQMAKGQLGQILSTAVGVGTSDRNDGGQSAAMAAQMANQMIQLRYGRGDESQSDSYGLRLMNQVGYDPRAMLDVMKILKDASKGDRQPEWLSSHPLPETRIQQIEDELNREYGGGSKGSIGRGRTLSGNDYR